MRLGRRGWSIYGAERAQPVATDGTRRTRKELRQAETVAVGCEQFRPPLQGKEGSTARVRQSACKTSNRTRRVVDEPSPLSQAFDRASPIRRRACSTAATASSSVA
jgi:hypothetical protein